VGGAVFAFRKNNSVSSKEARPAHAKNDISPSEEKSLIEVTTLDSLSTYGFRLLSARFD
jgi:hypothetical protein